MSGLARRLARQIHKSEPGRGSSVSVEAIPKRMVAICTPCGDEMATPYTVSLVQMLMHTWNEHPGDLGGISFNIYGSSILPFSRNILAAAALEKGATDLLWIDSDMEFAPDTLLRLMRHDLPIVGANCSARRPPFKNTARIGDDELVTTLDSTGVEKVDRLGFGVVLIKAEVFRSLPLPWFTFEWMPEKSVFLGEDFYFFREARKKGYEVYVDQDVSKGVRHMGTFGYSPSLKAFSDELNRTAEESRE